MAVHEAITPIILAILYGAIAASTYASVGYFKTTGGDPQKFDKVKFLSTLILGLILGGIGGYLGWSPQVVEEWLAGMMLLGGVLILVEWLAKGIIRRLPSGSPLSEDTGGQVDLVSLVALLTAIPSAIVAYALFLTFVGGNGLILGSVMGAIGIITTKILIDRKNSKVKNGSRS